MEFNIKMSAEDVNLTLQALSQGPYAKVAGTIKRISDQVKRHTDDAQPPAETADAAKPNFEAIIHNGDVVHRPPKRRS